MELEEALKLMKRYKEQLEFEDLNGLFMEKLLE